MNPGPAQQSKLNDALARRLEQLTPGQTIRMIVLLSIPALAHQGSGRASRRANRAATIEAMRAAAQPGFAEVDRVLTQHGGRRLNGNLSALGAVAVETTADGARALAESEQVRAILEDQPVHGVLTTGS